MFQFIFWIITTALSYMLAPKPPVPKPASLEDFDAPTATEGRAVPVIFGTVTVKSPNVVWYGHLKTAPNKS
ncbi:hypothetical protein [Candidatus Vondammii sp. HM_W22]|uniref:hypothetical protein n=1 Tax=Candidatus Vondammii sp. HM_W22 TaxID=2687299 RepID=UPI002E7BAAE8|nr:hypothetical protein [Candidatus Vondammii sp. HM_W22]